MAEYIEKDALLKDLKDKCDYELREYRWSGEYIKGFTHATDIDIVNNIDIVNKVPPLNAAIVKHGQWISTNADVVDVVRCKDCAVPHNRWTGCPKLNGLVTPPDFYCSYGERRGVLI